MIKSKIDKVLYLALANTTRKINYPKSQEELLTSLTQNVSKECTPKLKMDLNQSNFKSHLLKKKD